MSGEYHGNIMGCNGIIEIWRDAITTNNAKTKASWVPQHIQHPQVLYPCTSAKPHSEIACVRWLPASLRTDWPFPTDAAEKKKNRTSQQGNGASRALDNVARMLPTCEVRTCRLFRSDLEPVLGPLDPGIPGPTHHRSRVPNTPGPPVQGWPKALFLTEINWIWRLPFLPHKGTKQSHTHLTVRTDGLQSKHVTLLHKQQNYSRTTEVLV